MPHPRDGIPTGVNQSPSGGSAYPFINPSADIQGLLTDAWLIHEFRQVELPLRIVRLVGLSKPPGSASSEAGESDVDGSNAVQVLIADANNDAVFDSEGGTYSGREFSPRFYIHEWRTETAICQLVQHTGVNVGEEPRSWPHILEPEDGTLDERISELLPRRLSSLRVGERQFKEKIELVAGYNARLSSPGETLTPASPFTLRRSVRSRIRLRLDLASGLGAGRFPACQDPDPVLRTLNRQGPDEAGNLQLVAARCYWVRQPSAVSLLSPREITLTPATLQIGNDCQPCCDCVDYENTYLGILNVFNKFKQIGQAAEAVRDVYAQNKERWLTRRECRINNPLDMMLLSSARGIVTLQASLVNTSRDCLADVTMTFELESRNVDGFGGIVASPVLVSGTVFLTDAVTGRWTAGSVDVQPQFGEDLTITAAWERVGPGASVKARFNIVTLNDGECANVVTIRFTGAGGGSALPGLVEKSIQTVCGSTDQIAIA